MASLVQRGPIYYIQFYIAGKLKRVSTSSDVLQVAKEKLRQFESAQARGDALPLPTRTPIADVVTAYVEHIRTIKTPKSAQTDIYYLRDMFGPICKALEITSRKVGAKSKRRPPKPGQDRRRKAPVIEANAFEQITTADISSFIAGRMASRGLIDQHTAGPFRPGSSPIEGRMAVESTRPGSPHRRLHGRHETLDKHVPQFSEYHDLWHPAHARQSRQISAGTDNELQCSIIYDGQPDS
jgi:hypothetical protein